jgi:ABC-type glycerol-3-phosphate transport system permease component
MTRRIGKRKVRFSRLASPAFLLVYAIFTWFPLYWLFLIAVRPEEETAHYPPLLFTTKASLDGFAQVISKFNLGRMALNSLVVSGITTGLCLVVGIMTAYFLSRSVYSNSFKLAVSYLFFAILIIPPIVLLVPAFLVLSMLKLYNTYTGLIIPYTVLLLPFAITILKNVFDHLPRESEEAAMIDGLGRISAFIKITLPGAISGMASAAVIIFMFAWSEFVFALVLTASDKAMTLPIGVWSTMSLHGIFWRDISSGAVLAIIPPLILGFFVQKPLAKGLGLGA